jgi:hypothetical protein
MYKVEKDSICFFSQEGHKGFLYPNKDRHTVISKDSLLDILPWVKIHDLTPVVVRSESLLGKFEFKYNRVVVWMRSKNIKNIKKNV